MDQTAWLRTLAHKTHQTRSRCVGDMTQTDSPHFAALQFHRNHDQALPTSSRPRTAAQVSLVGQAVGVPAPSPAATSATSARPSSCPDRVRAAKDWVQEATLPKTNSAAPASCAGWFPPWERSAVGRRYRTPFLARSPSWAEQFGKRTPLASATQQACSLANRSVNSTRLWKVGPTVSVFAANNAKSTTRVKWIKNT